MGFIKYFLEDGWNHACTRNFHFTGMFSLFIKVQSHEK